jgi:hypothetical protein
MKNAIIWLRVWPFLIFALCNAAVQCTVSAGNLLSVMSPQFNLTFLDRRVRSADIQLVFTPRSLWKYFTTDYRALVLKYWQFLSEYCHLVLAKNMDSHTFYCVNFQNNDVKFNSTQRSEFVFFFRKNHRPRDLTLSHCTSRRCKGK